MAAETASYSLVTATRPIDPSNMTARHIPLRKALHEKLKEKLVSTATVPILAPDAQWKLLDGAGRRAPPRGVLHARCSAASNEGSRVI